MSGCAPASVAAAATAAGMSRTATGPAWVGGVVHGRGGDAGQQAERDGGGGAGGDDAAERAGPAWRGVQGDPGARHGGQRYGGTSGAFDTVAYGVSCRVRAGVGPAGSDPGFTPSRAARQGCPTAAHAANLGSPAPAKRWCGESTMVPGEWQDSAVPGLNDGTYQTPQGQIPWGIWPCGVGHAPAGRGGIRPGRTRCSTRRSCRGRPGGRAWRSGRACRYRRRCPRGRRGPSCPCGRRPGRRGRPRRPRSGRVAARWLRESRGSETPTCA